MLNLFRNALVSTLYEYYYNKAHLTLRTLYHCSWRMYNYTFMLCTYIVVYKI